MKSMRKGLATLLALLTLAGALSVGAWGKEFFAAKDVANRYETYANALAELAKPYKEGETKSLHDRYVDLQKAAQTPIVSTEAAGQVEAAKAALAEIAQKVEPLLEALTVQPGDTFIANSTFTYTGDVVQAAGTTAFDDNAMAWVNLRFLPGTLENTKYNGKYNNPVVLVPVMVQAKTRATRQAKTSELCLIAAGVGTLVQNFPLSEPVSVAGFTATDAVNTAGDTLYKLNDGENLVSIFDEQGAPLLTATQAKMGDYPTTVAAEPNPKLFVKRSSVLTPLYTNQGTEEAPNWRKIGSALGQPTEVFYEDGAKVHGKDSATGKYKYTIVTGADSKAAYDADGKPIVLKVSLSSGAPSMVDAYDENGDPIMEQAVDGEGKPVYNEQPDTENPLYSLPRYPAVSAGNTVLDRSKTVYAGVADGAVNDPEGKNQVFSYFTLGKLGYLTGSPFAADIANNTTLTVPGLNGAGGKALGFAPAGERNPATNETIKSWVAKDGDNTNGSYPFLPFVWQAPSATTTYAFNSAIYRPVVDGVEGAAKRIGTAQTFYGAVSNTSALGELIDIDYACEYDGVNGKAQAIFTGWRIVSIDKAPGMSNTWISEGGVHSANAPYNNYEITLEAQWKEDPGNPLRSYTPNVFARTWNLLKYKLMAWALAHDLLNIFSLLGIESIPLEDEYKDPMPWRPALIPGILNWVMPFAEWMMELTGFDLMALLEGFGISF